MSRNPLKLIGACLTILGVALFAYNAFNYVPSMSSIGSYYPDGAKLGMAFGAALAVAGIFSYIEGLKRDPR